MDPLRHIKMLVVAGGVALGLALLASGSLSMKTEASDKSKAAVTAASSAPTDSDYVGSETCKTCHEDQFNSYAKTAHAHLGNAGWKAEKQGCESCHGAG